MADEGLITRRPAETATGGAGAVALMVIGILAENGIEVGPYTAGGITFLVGLVPTVVTWFVSRRRAA